MTRADAIATLKRLGFRFAEPISAERKLVNTLAAYERQLAREKLIAHDLLLP